MNVIPWVKQQDFCLRIGMLRALVAILPPHERSVDRGPVLLTVQFADVRSDSEQPGAGAAER